MKFNKSITGYHMLVLLSEVDGYFDDAEKAVVEEYIRKNFPIPINLETENKVLATLPKELFMEHFIKVANDFYFDSNEDERIRFLDFAFKLMHADAAISREENTFIDALYTQWDMGVDE